MIRYRSSKQLTLAEFDWPFQTGLDENNRWVTLAQSIPWDELAQAYHAALDQSGQGRPSKDARLVIGAVIIKHKLCLSDRETVAQLQENPYLQYFVGLPGYQQAAPFAPSLLVEVRKRMGQGVFDAFHASILEALERNKPTKGSPRAQAVRSHDDDEPPGAAAQDESPAEADAEPARQGKLILDATVAPQAIRYPTDLSLLNEAREFTEQIIDVLYAHSALERKPRTYRQRARREYLAVAKLKRASAKVRRRGIKQQLQYLRRNLGHIETLLASWPQGVRLPLPGWLLRRYWVIPHLYAQQREMYERKARRCDRRIVSISQPHVRPIVRGKVDRPVEFGAKFSVNLNGDGLACVDHLSWEAYHEGNVLEEQVERYRERHGHYPEVVIADQVYGTRHNRRYLKQRHIRFAGKALGRPKKVTEENRTQLREEKHQRRRDYLARIPIEGKFGQAKGGYRLNYIRAKRADTSVAWINSIFLVMNLLVLLKFFFALCQWTTKVLYRLHLQLKHVSAVSEWLRLGMARGRLVPSFHTS
jgi:hypothetical protein